MKALPMRAPVAVMRLSDPNNGITAEENNISPR